MKLEGLFTGFLAMVFLGAAYIASNWPPRASLIVFILCAIAVPLLLAQLCRDLFLSRRSAVVQRQIYDIPGSADGPPAARWRADMEIWFWLLGLVVGIRLIGFLPSVALFVFGYARWNGTRSVPAFLLAFFAWAFLYLLFDQVMHIPWPDPLLLDLFS